MCWCAVSRRAGSSDSVSSSGMLSRIRVQSDILRLPVELVRVLEHLDKDFLGRVFRRLAVPKEAVGEVVHPRAVTVVDLRGGGEIARLNDAHQLLIAQGLHLPRFSLL